MDAAWFAGLKALARNAKHAITEVCLLDCMPPRPVAVHTRIGFRLLPEDMWPVAELITRAAQGKTEMDEQPPCTITEFLVKLLAHTLTQQQTLECVVAHGGALVLLLRAPRLEP